MSQIETVIRASKQLEQLLEQHYGASGRGLHEKTSSVEAQLDADSVRQMRKIATLRNKVVHEDFEIDDLVEFQADAQKLLQRLHPKTNSKAKNRPAKNQLNRATSEPSPAKIPTPRPQPRVQLPSTATPEPAPPPTVKPQQSSKNQPTKPKTQHKARPSAQQRVAQQTSLPSVLPAISTILILVAIIWILAH